MIHITGIEDLLKKGWYLDTSLFQDFIQKNIRVGFDNAIDCNGKTIVHINCSSSKRQVWVPMIINGKNVSFELTNQMEMLQNFQLSHDLNFYYSDITKAEVIRNLRKGFDNKKKSDLKKNKPQKHETQKLKRNQQFKKKLKIKLFRA